MSEKFIEIIYSAILFENINNLNLAFDEMKRILSDHGFLVHNYNLLYCSNGGHALSIMDSLWRHLLVENEDFLDYRKQYIRQEYFVAKDWIEYALNKVSTAGMQQYIIESGFEILILKEVLSSKQHTDLLTQPLMEDIFIKNPSILMADLITQNVFFVARKAK